MGLEDNGSAVAQSAVNGGRDTAVAGKAVNGLGELVRSVRGSKRKKGASFGETRQRGGLRLDVVRAPEKRAIIDDRVGGGRWRGNTL